MTVDDVSCPVENGEGYPNPWQSSHLNEYNLSGNDAVIRVISESTFAISLRVVYIMSSSQSNTFCYSLFQLSVYSGRFCLLKIKT